MNIYATTPKWQPSQFKEGKQQGKITRVLLQQQCKRDTRKEEAFLGVDAERGQWVTKTKCRLNFQRFKIGKQVQHFLTNQPTSFTRTLAQTEEKKCLFQRFTVEIHLLEDYSFSYYLGTSSSLMHSIGGLTNFHYSTRQWNGPAKYLAL